MPMPRHELTAILAAEKADALAAVSATKLSDERQRALDYYNGDMSRDMPSLPGRSQAVSTDVADTVEGLMPSLMEIFCGSDEVVEFDPVGPEDTEAAQQETDYVNHVFMQQNHGFQTMYSFVKDALLSKVGVVKVYWDASEKEERETYFDQAPDVLAQIVSDPGVEVVEHTEHDGVHDITIARIKHAGRARVETVPPEEFGTARNTRVLSETKYFFHSPRGVTEADLIAQGFDPDQLRTIPSYGRGENPEERSRDTVEEYERDGGDSSGNRSTRVIEVTEHYILLDYEQDGKTNRYRVTTAGAESTILKRDGKDAIDLVELLPFAAMTPYPVPHRFYGKSVADFVMDIQRIKTALIRQLLDNAYLANNPRIEVAEAHTGDSTLDDLLVSRPGGIVRTKTPGGLLPLVVPSIAQHLFPLVEYFDATREWRTGVTRQGQGIDANALHNQSATAVNQAFTAAQARMKLIARIFAETGVRDLFALLHATIRKHGSEASRTVRLRNQWVQVDPRNWKTRDDMTIKVGLGTGSKSERVAHLMQVAGVQKQLLEVGKTNLVSDLNLFNTTKELTKLVGLHTVDPYFTDPSKVPPPEPKPDPKMMEVQGKLKAQEVESQARMVMDQQKSAHDAQADMTRMQAEFDLKRIQMDAEMQLKREQMAAEMQLKREQMMLDMEIKRASAAHSASLAANESAAIDGVRMGGEVG